MPFHSSRTELRNFGLALGFVLILGLVLFPVLQYERLGSRAVRMEKGVLDASGLDFSEGLYQLAGEAETYPNLLIEPEDGILDASVTDAALPDAVEYQSLPFAWRADSGVRFGSYRFVLTNLTPGASYGFILMDPLTACEVFVDGTSVAQVGKPSAQPDETVGGIRVQAVSFTAAADRAEVVIHVSSRSSNFVGIWQKTLFGPSPAVHAHDAKARQADAVVIGALFVVTAFSWIALMLVRRDRMILSFAMTATFVLLKTLMSGQQLLMSLFPGIPYEAAIRAAYLCVPLVAVSITGFAYSLFRHPRLRIAFLVLCGISAVQSAALLLLPQRWYQQTFFLYQGVVVAYALLVLASAIISMSRGIYGSGVFVAGYIVFFLTAINDVLYSQALVETGYVLGIGMLSMMMSQLVLLALRMGQALRTEAFLKKNLEREVQQRTIELEAERARYEELAKMDGLTRLMNKTTLMELIGHEMDGFLRFGQPASVIMIDLDHFKNINDTYGHLFGDTVLQQVAGVLSARSRSADVIGRFGGEEFLMLLRSTGMEDALRHAEQLRTALEKTPLDICGQPVHVTGSFGVATATAEVTTANQLVRAADDAMYVAKNRGRNCTVPYGGNG